MNEQHLKNLISLKKRELITKTLLYFNVFIFLLNIILILILKDSDNSLQFINKEPYWAVFVGYFSLLEIAIVIPYLLFFPLFNRLRIVFNNLLDLKYSPSMRNTIEKFEERIEVIEQEIMKRIENFELNSKIINEKYGNKFKFDEIHCELLKSHAEKNVDDFSSSYTEKIIIKNGPRSVKFVGRRDIENFIKSNAEIAKYQSDMKRFDLVDKNIIKLNEEKHSLEKEIEISFKDGKWIRELYRDNYKLFNLEFRNTKKFIVLLIVTMINLLFIALIFDVDIMLYIGILGILIWGFFFSLL